MAGSARLTTVSASACPVDLLLRVIQLDHRDQLKVWEGTGGLAVSVRTSATGKQEQRTLLAHFPKLCSELAINFRPFICGTSLSLYSLVTVGSQ